MSMIKHSDRPIYFIVTLLLGIAVGNRISSWRGYAFDHSEIYMVTLTLLILIILMFRERYFDVNSVRNLEEMKKSSQVSWDALTEWIMANLSPIIVSLQSNNEVLRQASDIIKKAISEADPKDKRVVYIGSGDLLKDPPPTSDGDDANTPVSNYISTMALVTNTQLNVTRYISLLDENEYAKRANETKAAYRKWLGKQILLLDQNPKYIFFDCMRAPKWGSSRSSVFTERAVLDVIGNGQSGVLIRGEQVARTLREASENLFITAVNEPVLKDKEELSKYLAKLELADSGGRAQVEQK